MRETLLLAEVPEEELYMVRVCARDIVFWALFRFWTFVYGRLANCTMAVVDPSLHVCYEWGSATLPETTQIMLQQLSSISWLVWTVRKQGNVHIMEIGIDQCKKSENHFSSDMICVMLILNFFITVAFSDLRIHLRILRWRIWNLKFCRTSCRFRMRVRSMKSVYFEHALHNVKFVL